MASIDAVRDEISAGSGDVVDWARARPTTFWLTDTSDVVTAMAQLSAWAIDTARQDRQKAVGEFLDSVDYKLIAHSMAVGATAVTASSPPGTPRRRSRIPDVCNAFGVAWTDRFKPYRTLGMRLIA